MKIARRVLVFLCVFIGGFSCVFFLASIGSTNGHIHHVNPLPAIASALAIGLCSIALALQGSRTSRWVLVLLLWGCVLLALIGCLILIFAAVISIKPGTRYDFTGTWEHVVPIALAAGLGSIAACIASKEDPPSDSGATTGG